jgi:hypothetical protein
MWMNKFFANTVLWAAGVAVVFAMVVWAETPEEHAPNQSRAPRLGMNFEGIVDWNRDLPFVDMMKYARPWIPQNEDKAVWDTGASLAIDAEGYVTSLAPGQRATTLMLTDLQGHYPAGPYVFLYEGEGAWEWSGLAELVESKPGRQVVNVRADGAAYVQLTLTEVNPENHPRNMRFIRPGYEAEYASNPYAKDFLDRWGGVDTIRFMDWMRINRTDQSEWSNRPTPDLRSFYTTGVALEWMIDLCNRTDSHAWFAMPHLATDEYIREFARKVREGLAPHLKAYYEFSNEVWNSMFEQTRWAERKGVEAGLAERPWEAGWLYYAEQSRRMFTLLDEVYQGEHDRYCRVVSVQAANDYVGRRKLGHHDLGAHADALAIAPYLTLNVPMEGRDDQPGAAEVQGWSLDQLFEYLNNKPMADSKLWMERYFALASEYGLKLIAYEGGQHLTALNEAGANEKLVELLAEANRDPRMGDLYRKYFAHWSEVTGGNLFCHWTATGKYGRHGSWGLLEWRTQDPATSPKYQALKDWSGMLP